MARMPGRDLVLSLRWELWGDTEQRETWSDYCVNWVALDAMLRRDGRGVKGL